MLASTARVVTVPAVVTALYFDARSWAPFAGGLVLIGLIYAGLGALAGSVLERLAATYLMLFLVMTDLGIVQNPMFGDGDPGGLAVALPGYGPSQVMIEGAYSPGFSAGGELLVSLVWVGLLASGVWFVLRRAIGGAHQRPASAPAGRSG